MAELRGTLTRSFQGKIGPTRAASAPWWPEARRAPKGTPNIVIVYMDDMSYADVGCFGSEIATPYIDALAARGLRFNHYTNVTHSHLRHRLLPGQFLPWYATTAVNACRSRECALYRLVGSCGHFVNRYGLMNSRRVDFQHFQVIRAIKFVMNDPRWLQDTITGLERMLSLAFVHELNPAF
jgi:hypothetical protein